MPSGGGSSSSSAGAPLDPTQHAIHALAYRILRVPLKPVSGTLCRAIRAKYLQRTPPEPLYYLASAARGARYTPLHGPAGLYLASDPATAFAEIRDLAQSPAGKPLPLRPRGPVMLVYVETDLDGVLDVTDAGVRRTLRVTRRAILEEWQVPMHSYLAGEGMMPLTQQIGVAAHITSVVKAVLYPSARWKGGRCLVVLPDRIAASDRVASYDPAGALAQALPP